MKTLRGHIRELQLLENKAAEKAGMRFLLLNEELLVFGVSKFKDNHIKNFAKKLEEDISPEVVEAAKMGKEINRMIKDKSK